MNEPSLASFALPNEDANGHCACNMKETWK
jgi:hypothetical protein